MLDLSKLSQPDASLLQSGLKALGFYSGTTRGLPGPKTESAYTRYLASRNAGTSFSEALARAAESQIGQREEGDNGGESVRMYQASTWYAPAPWPWCAAFVCWCFQKAQQATPIAMDRPTTPGAWDFENWARKAGAELIKPVGSKSIRRGDIVVFTFSHIGIAVKDATGDTISTVEGNTNGEGSREGDGVYAKTRKRSQIRSIIRM